MEPRMLIASIRFSANPANSANATAKMPHRAVNRLATRTLRASSAAASGRKWRQKSIVVVVPGANGLLRLDDGNGMPLFERAERGAVFPLRIALPLRLVEEHRRRLEQVEDEQQGAEQENEELHRDLQERVEDEPEPAFAQG